MNKLMNCNLKITSKKTGTVIVERTVWFNSDEKYKKQLKEEYPSARYEVTLNNIKLY